MCRAVGPTKRCLCPMPDLIEVIPQRSYMRVDFSYRRWTKPNVWHPSLPTHRIAFQYDVDNTGERELLVFLGLGLSNTTSTLLDILPL